MSNANPFAGLDDTPAPTQPRRKREASRRSIPWFYYAVGLLVAVAAVVFIYDRGETYYSRKRLESIRKEQEQVFEKITQREREMEAQRRPAGDSLDLSSTDHLRNFGDFRDDPQLKKLYDRDSELAEQERRILRRHPQFDRD